MNFNLNIVQRFNNFVDYCTEVIHDNLGPFLSISKNAKRTEMVSKKALSDELAPEGRKQEKVFTKQMLPALQEALDKVVVHNESEVSPQQETEEELEARAMQLYKTAMDNVKGHYTRLEYRVTMLTTIFYARRRLSPQDFIAFMNKNCSKLLQPPRVERDDEIVDQLPVQEIEEPRDEPIEQPIIPGCGGDVQSDEVVEEPIEQPMMPGCGGAVQNLARTLPAWVLRGYDDVFSGKQNAAKLAEPMNLFITRETVLNKDETYGILFGLLNQLVADHAREQRNGHVSKRPISGLSFDESKQRISGFSLEEQAKLFFASHNLEFRKRSRQLNPLIKVADLVSLSDALEYNFRHNYRFNATAQEKNELRVVLSDTQRQALGVYAPRK
ncbi:MAG: hypothetical protein JSR46_04585 [Verrucomicrobia bacterium]|nr:hypothetical protein [Verrucomicrobiota bacterium]